MAKDAHINLIQDPDHHILVIRIQGFEDSTPPDPTSLLAAVQNAVTFDLIFDLRRFHGPLDETFISNLRRIWLDIVGEKGLQTHIALILRDYNLKGRLEANLKRIKAERIGLFDDFDLGLDWLRSRQTP